MKKIQSSLAQRHARIEIIPLIDIMFFLLASFMLVSLTMSKQQSIKVNLPTATQAHPDLKPEMISLSVDRAGGVFLQRQAVTFPELYRALTEGMAGNTNLPVYISGDLDATHGQMVQVLDLVRKAGFQKVAFNVQADMTKP
jgi:biopolymer transport protein ExbD